MAYSKAKLKSNGNRASPCFSPLWIGNLSDKSLPIRTLLWVSFKHILIILTSFLGVPHHHQNNESLPHRKYDYVTTIRLSSFPLQYFPSIPPTRISRHQHYPSSPLLRQPTVIFPHPLTLPFRAPSQFGVFFRLLSVGFCVLKRPGLDKWKVISSWGLTRITGRISDFVSGRSEFWLSTRTEVQWPYTDVHLFWLS
jgi:hypothetical protein